jgi:hypothetical protein
MQHENYHPSDRELLQAVDGELSDTLASRVREHLVACWACRARVHELQGAIADFIRLHHRSLDGLVPPVTCPRALLKARLAEIAVSPESRQERWPRMSLRRRRVLEVSAACALAFLAVLLASRSTPTRDPHASVLVVPFSSPNVRLTPGVAALESREQICGEDRPKNKAVPASLQRKVFEEYGIARADPGAYEVDYLITPALGGSDDLRNLWPQPYSATIWNARVKDALEDRLHDMVCRGEVDLGTAQRDIAQDWIAAYKKYFQTDAPLAEPSQ